MEQTFIAGLAIGLLAGWLIEFVIDVFYWRRGDSTGGVTNKLLVDASLRLATANQHSAILGAELEARSGQDLTLSDQLAGGRREAENLRAQLAAIGGEEPDDMLNAFREAAGQSIFDQREEDTAAFKEAAAHPVVIDDTLGVFREAAEQSIFDKELENSAELTAFKEAAARRAEVVT